MWNQNKYSNISKLQSKDKIFPQPNFIANEINKYFSDVPTDLVNVMDWSNSGNFHTQGHHQVIWWRNLEDWEEKFYRRIPQPRAALGVVSKSLQHFHRQNATDHSLSTTFPVTEWTFK